MNLKNISFVLLLVLLAACGKPATSRLAPEAVYNEEGLAVITSFFNNRLHTTTILYGNVAAQQALAKGSAGQSAGEDYRLVTWEQYANPLWFGSNINGQIKSVERVTTTTTAENTVVSHYGLMQGNLATIAARDSADQKRIQYIYSLTPLAFP